MKLLQKKIGLAALVLLPLASRADSVTIVASRDTTIYQAAPSNSDGAGQALFVGTDGGGGIQRALIGFDIASNVPAGSTITGVQFRLVLDRAASIESLSRSIQLCRVLADWGEGTAGQGTDGSGGGQGFPTPPDGTSATWTHRFYNTVPWTRAGGDFVATASGSTVVGLVSMAYLWDSTPGLVSDVQSWLDNPANNFGWLLLGDESTLGTSRRFFSREVAATNSRPSLVITFTPPSVVTATKLAITAPANVIAGSPFDITVAALTDNDIIDPGYTGTVTFTSSDLYPSVLPANYTFTAADQGTHTFSGGGTFFTAGSQTLTVQDTANASITGTATVAVTAAPASRLLITAPANAVSGMAFDVAVAAVDPYGNVDTNYSGTVTWATSDPDPGVVLPANYTFTAADGGTHSFPGGVVLVTAGDQTLAAGDTVTGIAGLATVTVGPGP